VGGTVCAVTSVRAARPALLLWGAYILSLSLLTALHLPGTGALLQLPEFVACILVPFTLWTSRGNPVAGSFMPLDRCVLAYTGFTLLAVLSAGLSQGVAARSLLVEALATVYLSVIYFCMRRSAPQFRAGELLPCCVGMGSLAAVCGLLGVLAFAASGTPNPLITYAETGVPYAGIPIRARGFTVAPSMMGSLIFTAAFAGLTAGRTRLRAPVSALWTLAVVLGVVKSILCFLAAVVARVVPGPGVLRALCAGTLVVVYVFISHFMICSPQAKVRYDKLGYTAGPAMPLGNGEKVLSLTGYSHIKQMSILAIEQSWPWGIGSGQHEAFGRQNLHRFSGRVMASDPHGTYLGAVAELGLLGTLAALALGYGIVRSVKALPWHLRGVAEAALIYVLLEGITTDVLHFRHYWVALALLANRLGEEPVACSSQLGRGNLCP
jgi:hypothetical protein